MKTEILMKKQSKIAEHIALVICTLSYVALMFAIITSARLSATTVNMFGYPLGVGNLCGIMCAFQTLLCIVLVCINFKKGTLISNILMLMSLIASTIAVIKSQSLSPLPGICMTIISMISIFILYRQLTLREKDAITDYLTGLNNRRGLLKNLELKIRKNTPFSLIYIDIDDFKYINDTMSHKEGDEVLRVISSRIEKLVDRQGITARIGGDEFIVILPAYRDADDFCEKLIKSVSSEIMHSGGDFSISSYVTTSIGIASFPNDSRDMDELVKLADIAMYQAKHNGKNKFVHFDISMTDESVKQANLEALIKKGLDKDTFYLVFQPQYESSTKKLRGFETLLRLKDENGVNISPAEFIPAAEKTDLILDIDRYVLKKSMSTFVDVAKKADEPFVISVNVSAKNTCNKEFPAFIKQLLEVTGFPAHCLEIEITEYCLAQSLNIAVANINKLKEMGIKIALDDFGTGYASLSHLSNLPVDLLKIDKSFIDNIESDKVSKDFVNAVISMGHILGCEVISEGVETEAQIDLLHNQECDYIQGYVWGRPMDFSEAVKLC